MPTDLDLMTLPTGESYEIFDAVNAWDGAAARIVVSVNKMAGGTYQIGYDPDQGKHHFRIFDGSWSLWNDFVGPPKPVEEPTE